MNNANAVLPPSEAVERGPPDKNKWLRVHANEHAATWGCSPVDHLRFLAYPWTTL